MSEYNTPVSMYLDNFSFVTIHAIFRDYKLDNVWRDFDFENTVKKASTQLDSDILAAKQELKRKRRKNK